MFDVVADPPSFSEAPLPSAGAKTSPFQYVFILQRVLVFLLRRLILQASFRPLPIFSQHFPDKSISLSPFIYVSVVFCEPLPRW